MALEVGAALADRLVGSVGAESGGLRVELVDLLEGETSRPVKGRRLVS